MFFSAYEWSHVRWSESRVFMALTMGGTMGLIMLAWMLNMYRNAKANIAIVVVSLLPLGGGTYLDRSQVTVHDAARSEERRVGKECRSRRWPDDCRREQDEETDGAVVYLR